MLNPLYIIAVRPGHIMWLSGVSGMTGVLARIYLDGVEIDQSPVSCSPHVIPGVYIGALTVDVEGSYLIKWSGNSGNVRDEQPLYVVLSLHTTTIQIKDSDSEAYYGGVRVKVLEFANIGYNLVSEALTDQEGQVSMSLPEGTYRVCLEKTGCIFTVNGSELVVDYLDEEVRALVSTHMVEVPASGYTPPSSTVTMTATLIDVKGDPMRFRDVHIVSVDSPGYHSGDDFIVAQSRVTAVTDSNGYLSVTLIPGTYVEVSIAGTSVVRRFTVPSQNFDLFAFVGNNDSFDVQNQVYPPAHRVS